MQSPDRPHSGTRCFRRTPVAQALAGLLLVAAGGCAAGGVGGAAVPVEETVFAEQLHVDLASMERSESGLYTRDLRVGTGEEARRGSRVSVHYAGWLPDATQFDARVAPADPIEFRLGDGDVIRGWDEGIVGMREGGQRQLVVPARLAYGSGGRGPIPPGAHLVFLIELVEVR